MLARLRELPLFAIVPASPAGGGRRPLRRTAMMVARALGTVAIVGFLACPALVQAQAGEAELAAQDLEFAEKAAEGGFMEVQLGELAQQQAKDEQVVQFGQRMVQDHGQANEKLMAIAEQKGIQLPQELPEDEEICSRRLWAAKSHCRYCAASM
jgi:predicted outer membrane protein